MKIFENLKNLNVSEECFNDICENIFSAIKKKYPESKDVLKRVHLEKEARENRRNERNEAIKRETKSEDLGNTPAKVYLKREQRGKDNIYRTPFEQLKLNREEKKRELMDILKKGLRDTEKSVSKINKASEKLRNKQI